MIDEIDRFQLKIKELEDQLALARKDSQKANLLQQELDRLKGLINDRDNEIARLKKYQDLVNSYI